MTIPDHGGQRSHVIQGQYQVSADADAVLVTILGSCIAACIRDPLAGIGGMNHFLLPADEPGQSGSDVERYGVHLMELLVNKLMAHGAQRDRLEAKLFGGARMMRGLSDIGKKNAEFAMRFLMHEGIRIVATDVGGERGRRLQYWPVSGRARQSYMAANDPAGTALVARPVIPKHVDQIDLF